MTTERNQTTSEWADMSDEQLREYEQRLYDRDVAGEDVWFERDQVLWEMSRRGMFK